MPIRLAFQPFSRSWIASLLAGLLSSAAGAQEVKYIPIEQTPPRAGGSLEIVGQGYSVKVEPALVTSQKITGGVSNALQQQMKMAIEQAISPSLSIIYRAEAGFKTIETDLLGQEELVTAYLSMLQRPALLWKPRPDSELEVAHETLSNLNQTLAWEEVEAVAARARVKLSDQTALSLTARSEDKTAYTGEKTSQTTFQAPVERTIANTPLKLVIGPGYQSTSAADGTQAIRAFVEQSVIWKLDDWTSLTVGSNTAPLFLSELSDSSSYFLLVQHKVLPGALIEMRASVLQSETPLAGEGYAISAQSTVALAEALSAGLGLRYKMDQNPALSRPGSETFLSLSLNGKF